MVDSKWRRLEMAAKTTLLVLLLSLSSCMLLRSASFSDYSDDLVEYCELKGSTKICSMIPKSELNRIMRGQ